MAVVPRPGRFDPQDELGAGQVESLANSPDARLTSLRPSRTIRACDQPPVPRPVRGSRPALFLDRDGTLIVDKPYNSDPRAIEVLPGVLDALRQLASAGYLLLVVTNQSGVARGFYDDAAVCAMHDRLDAIFAGVRVRVAAYYYCPHHVDGVIPALACPCVFRKPGPGMLLRAAAEWDVDLARSWLVGDSLTDTRAAAAAGCRALLVGSREVSASPVGRFRSLLEAARYVTGHHAPVPPGAPGARQAARPR